ncbi:MAG: mannose-1-phosphate guanylyltransferase/mannose-6-phosphate isomerase [Bermanella sp.]|jgi:mannose-1-phosphate guanylyltransferase/mannose-6-phosphate isomerase
MAIHPVILAGGSGSRLWPLSRQNHPKQFLDLLGVGDTLLQSTVKRAQLFSDVEPLIIANKEHRFLLQHQIEPLGLTSANVLLEPHARNTTGTVALACLNIMQSDPDAMLLCLPADHYLPDSKAFLEAVVNMANALPEKYVGLLGVKPDYAATQYGYIEFLRGETLHTVTRFIEKPEVQLADVLFARSDVAWNSGVVMARAQDLYDALSLHTPVLLLQVEKAFAESDTLYDFKLVGDSYGDIESLPFDISVLEKSDGIKVALLDQQWDDLGSWASLLARRKALGLANFNVFNDDKLVLAFGGKEVVLVQNDDILFVADQDVLSDMSAISEYLIRHNIMHLLNRIDVHRPWGQFKVLAQDEHFIVKRLMVYPGAQISLQSHQFRRENWVVVRGQAEVQLDDHLQLIEEGGCVSIAQNQKHRLRNPNEGVLEIIEVQTGERLDEQDIIRYDDEYQRHLKN